MKPIFILCVLLMLAGCANNPYASNGTTADTSGGALLGAVAGAVIGNQTGAPLAGAAIGAGLGGLAGYGVAHSGQATRNNVPPGYYAPPANNPVCPAGYTCVPQ
ncbi:YMGG-like glycine zipper-containing protein [Acidithiobacillus thiooxidans]|uniref:YMGG-like glycine zipper-containing protein n=1 Tax=Acidithiobacillus thiooxidans TaxID=930 RepID=UPI0028545B1B|nr:YMGG-like glycine zipper-containing protein [Acidithiobacillus thiooxidans]MDD2748664.1 YMGG-like glycine zipper-containing protein [Acidithiobacillus sp.]MDR7927116.1 YMGG-like glycine zipper-containing protein [Acidithiobacillus thiooxidans]